MNRIERAGKVEMYTKAEMKNFFQKELVNLKNSADSVDEKRKRYEKLQTLMNEYENQREPSGNLEKRQNRSIFEEYVMQKEQLSMNPVYQNLHNPSLKELRRKAQCKPERAIDAYETQMACQRNMASQKKQNVPASVTSKETQTAKKGFFSRVFDSLKSNRVEKQPEAKPNISGVKKPVQGTVRYYDKVIDKVKELEKDVCTEFKKAVLDKSQYGSVEFVINGRRRQFGDFGERCY